MAFPFFSLSKNQTDFTDGGVTIQIRAANDAIATIYEKDILIYLASLMVEKINAGEVPDQTFTFTAHDYLRVTGSSIPKRDVAFLVVTKSRFRLAKHYRNIGCPVFRKESARSWRF